MQRVRVALLALGLFALTLACYWPSLSLGFTNFDDNLLLTANPRVHGLSAQNVRWMIGLRTYTLGHWHPLTWLSLGLDHEIWGLEPRGYHLTNVLVHAANASLCYLLARAVFRRALPAASGARLELPAALCAVLWAVHPLRVESVSWITERRDVLCGLFWFPALLFYLRAQAPGATSRARRVALGLSLACFALSLLAKAWGITLPAVLLVLDLWPLRRFADKTAWARVLLEKLPYALLAFGAAIQAILAQHEAHALEYAAHIGLTGRIVQACYGLGFYVHKTLLPFDLSPLYLLRGKPEPSEPRFAAALVLVPAITLALVLMRRRLPAGLAAWSAYALTVSPVLGLTQSGIQLVADRYSYLSTVCLFLLAGGAVLRLRAGPWFALVLLACLPWLWWRTQAQQAVWRDPISLWEHALRIDPDNDFALNSRGGFRELQGDKLGARADYDAAIQIERHSSPGLLSLALFNRAKLRYDQGEVEGASNDYDEALRQDSANHKAYNNRGALKYGRGDWLGAEEDFGHVLGLQPRSVEAHVNRGNARLAQGKRELAAADFERALELAPANWRDRGFVEQRLKQAREHP